MTQWALHVQEEIYIWHKWNEYWIQRSQEVPVYFFRFEDVMTDPEPELKQLLSLALGVHPESLSSESFLVKRIREVVS